MRIKIGPKLIAAFGLMVLLMFALAVYSMTTSRKSLVQSVGKSSVFLADEMLKRINQGIYLKIEEFKTHSGHLVLHQSVSESHREFRELDNIEAYIDQKDREWVSAPKDKITPFMRGLINRDLSKHLRKDFIEFYQKKYGYKTNLEVIVTNKYGANIAQSGKTTDFRQNDEKWWQIAKAKGYYVSPVGYDESTADYAISLGIRIDDERGDFIGVMKAVISVKSIIRSTEITVKKYETTRIKVITNGGRLIYKTGVFNFFEDVSGRKFFKQLKGETGFFIAEAGGKERLYSYARSKGFRDFEGMPWILVMEHDVKEILRPVFKLRNKMAAGALLLIAIAAIVAFLMSRSITEPIAMLIRGVKQIGKGDLEYRVEVRTKDEMGELAAVFNQMAAKRRQAENALQKAHAELEMKVKQRTAALVTSNADLKQEIADRKQAQEKIHHLNAVLRALRNVNKLIVTQKNPDQLIKSACENFIATRGYYNAWIALFDDSGKFKTAGAAGVGERFSQLPEIFKGGDLTRCGRKALGQPGVMVIDNPAEACVDCPLAEGYAGREAMSIRLEYEDKVYGILSVSIPKGAATDREEQSLFEEVAADIAYALSVIESEAQKEALEAMYLQSQKMEAIGTLAGGVAHDFNNILTAIIGNANLALMKVGKEDTLWEEIEEIKIAGERAAALTRQLLAFSRKQIIQPKILDLNELLTDIQKMLGRLIGEDVEILTIPGPALWQVDADPGQMEQVIMNLVVNAKDAMPKGGKLTVETANVNLDGNYFRNHGIKEEQPGSYVMLSVSDTGIGMDKETQERIFEPFFTTKEIGKGTGLGLPTVYGIIKQNNGFIWAYSEPGQGSTFKIYLPKAKGDVAAEEKEQHPVTALGGSETVLIVEDDDSLRKFARTVLKRKGYKVLEAENGEDAFRVSEAHDGPIDLLITDVVMPRMGGKETAERLQPLYPQMKVIYMSGYTDNAIAHHGILAPGLNFLEKPFTPEGLARRVREVLDIEN